MPTPEAYHGFETTSVQILRCPYDGSEPSSTYPDEQRPQADQFSTIDIDLNAPSISLSGIAQYLRDLRQTNHLSLEAEQRIIEHARCGDQEAKHQLIQDRLPYVVYMATRYHVYAEHEDLLDIIGVANLAVTTNIDKALTKENPAAYLCGVAKREIRNYCFYHSRLMPIKDHRMRLAEAPKVISLDKLHENVVHCYLSSLAQGNISEISKVRLWQIRQALSQLPDRLRQVIELRTGINGQAYTFKDIAQMQNISTAVASRRYSNALEQLREIVQEW